MASPPSQQFVPKLLTILLTMVVLWVLWNIIYDQIIRTLREHQEVPRPTADTASRSPEVAPPPPAIPHQPDVPTASPPEGNAPVRIIEPLQQLTLPEEAHEHRSLTVSCKVELERLCAEVPPGGGRLKRCYRERENRLSLPCQQQVEEQAFSGSPTNGSRCGVPAMCGSFARMCTSVGDKSNSV